VPGVAEALGADAAGEEAAVAGADNGDRACGCTEAGKGDATRRAPAAGAGSASGAERTAAAPLVAAALLSGGLAEMPNTSMLGRGLLPLLLKRQGLCVGEGAAVGSTDGDPASLAANPWPS